MNLKKRSKEMKDFFNNKIDMYDSLHLQMMDNKIAITEVLNKDVRRILDLGVGTGLELIPLFEKFPNIYVKGIDITENMLEELKKRNFKNKLDIVLGDFFEVEFGNNYDAVISTSALHHFNKINKLKLYKKIYDSLKEGGQFINSDRFVNTEEEEISAIKEYKENPNNKMHIDTPLCVDNEINILKQVGFKEINFYPLKDENYKLMIATK